jgi:hypothetical protein
MDEKASNVQCKTLLIQKNEWVLRIKQTDLSHHLPASDKNKKKPKLHGRSISAARKLSVGARPLVVTTDHTFEGSTMRKHM